MAFRYDKDMERVMLEKKKEVVKELEALKKRLLEELSCMNKSTLTKFQGMLKDYNDIEYQLTTRINELEHKINKNSVSSDGNGNTVIDESLLEELEALKNDLTTLQRNFNSALQSHSLFQNGINANKNSIESVNATLLSHKAQYDKIISCDESMKNIPLLANLSALSQTINAFQNDIDDLFIQHRNDMNNVNEQFVAENLIPFPYATPDKTLNGITWTNNKDGTITVNGTATATSYYFLDVASVLPMGTYTISGCSSGGGSGKYFIRVRDYTDENNVTTIANDYGNGGTFTLTKDTPKRIYISIEKDVTVNNLTFKPMLEIGSVAHNYQPYNLSRKGIVEQIEAENLLPYPYFHGSSKTVNGITTTIDEKGIAHVKGTSTASANCFDFTARDVVFPSGTYTISGVPQGSNNENYRAWLGIYKSGTTTEILSKVMNSEPFTFTVNEPFTMIFRIGVSANVSVDVYYKPMLERGTIAHPFTEYRKSASKLREDIDKLSNDTGWITIKENGSYSDSNISFNVINPIQYRIINNQFWIKGNVAVVLPSNTLNTQINLGAIPSDYSIPSLNRVVSVNSITEGSYEDDTMDITILKVIDNNIYFSVTSKDIYKETRTTGALFNESVLLD